VLLDTDIAVPAEWLAPGGPLAHWQERQIA
jgi:hypothetical protein